MKPVRKPLTHILVEILVLPNFIHRRQINVPKASDSSTPSSTSSSTSLRGGELFLADRLARGAELATRCATGAVSPARPGGGSATNGRTGDIAIFFDQQNATDSSRAGSDQLYAIRSAVGIRPR